MKRKIDITDVEENIEIQSFEVEFPFYAKQESRYMNWENNLPGKLFKIRYLKFYDEFKYVEIEVPVVEVDENIKLDFYPSGKWIEQGSTLNYDHSYGYIIKDALKGEDCYQVSSEEDFVTHLNLYKEQINTRY